MAQLVNENDLAIERMSGYTPMVLVFKDGKYVDGWVGYSEADAYKSFLADAGFFLDFFFLSDFLGIFLPFMFAPRKMFDSNKALYLVLYIIHTI